MRENNAYNSGLAYRIRPVQPAAKPFRLTIIVATLLAWAGRASALGLGEIHSSAALGGRFFAEVELLTTGSENIDSQCFRLRQPASEDGLPWLKRALLTVRKGPRAVLEIRSEQPLSDPILQVGVVVGCGHEVRREYTLFLSPKREGIEETRMPVLLPATAVPEERARRLGVPRVSRGASEGGRPVPLPRREPHRGAGRQDRLMLSIGDDAGDAVLRLDGELASWKEMENAALQARRDLLRLEFRMLSALNEQAGSQLEAAEKLRSMEATLIELQQRAGEFSQRVESRGEGQPVVQGEAAPATQVAAPARPMPPAPEQPKPPVKSVAPPPREESLISEWSFYGLLLGGVIGLAGWLGWRQYQQRRVLSDGLPIIAPEPIPDPRRETEFDEPGGVDLPVEPAAMGMPMQVDLHLDDTVVAPPPAPPVLPAAARHDSQFSVSAATVDEHFEANPVMELAEIMLSFGRVKGAAQALQEFIDNNPEEALQPWIRLLDVYRMAGMRDEFDRVARNLNQHFNVEVLRWDASDPAPSASLEKLDFELVPREDEGPATAAAPKALTVEDMPHIRQTLLDNWRDPEIIEYLHRLLRDNRGGKRSGFTLEVVQEILFLIELRETLALIEREKNEQGDNK